GEQYIVIALDESDFLGAILKNLLDARTQGGPTGIFVVDLDLVVLQNLHDNGLVLEVLVLLLVRIRLRYQRVHALRSQRGNHHENNQQHQQNVDQRDDVHFRHRAALAIPNAHSHCTSPVGLPLTSSSRPVSRAVWEAARPSITSKRNDRKQPITGLVSRRLIRNRRSRGLALVLFGQKAQLIHTGGTDFIDDRDNIAVL